jgi:hypothetical protein
MKISGELSHKDGKSLNLSQDFRCVNINFDYENSPFLLFPDHHRTCAAAVAQQATPTPQLYSESTLRQLRELQKAALTSDYAYTRTAYLSNNIGPRLSGSPQAQRAVEVLSRRDAKAWTRVRLQKVMVPHWVRGEERGEIIEFSRAWLPARRKRSS